MQIFTGKGKAMSLAQAVELLGSSSEQILPAVVATSTISVINSAMNMPPPYSELRHIANKNVRMMLLAARVLTYTSIVLLVLSVILAVIDGGMTIGAIYSGLGGTAFAATTFLVSRRAHLAEGFAVDIGTKSHEEEKDRYMQHALIGIIEKIEDPNIRDRAAADAACVIVRKMAGSLPLESEETDQIHLDFG